MACGFTVVNSVPKQGLAIVCQHFVHLQMLLLLYRPSKKSGTCILTNCKVCYFDRYHRPLPPGCFDKICSDWRNRRCLNDWTQCIKDHYEKPAYLVSTYRSVHWHNSSLSLQGNRNLHTMRYFKCHLPPKWLTLLDPLKETSNFIIFLFSTVHNSLLLLCI